MKAYKDIFYKYVSLSLAGAVTIGILFGISGLNQVALAAVLVVWLIGNALSWQYRANSRTKTLTNLFESCQIEEYVEQCKTLDARSPRMTDPVSKNDIKLNLIAGLYALGRIDEMEKVLSEVEVCNRTSMEDMTQKVRYYNAAALALIEKGKLDDAEDNLDMCYRTMNNLKFKEPQLTRYGQICDSTMELINMREGNVDGLIEKFRAWSETSANKVNEIACRYRIAEILWHQDKRDDADEEFRYVAENGGDTIYAKRAREILDRKGKQTVKISIPS